ncbi:hypothetical protein SLE2022_376490 [Rubroshorea leprosula]
MDHQYHHQWRQLPAQANTCPFCATPHFPFCPAHPPHSQQNPSFPFPPPHYPRPGFDPYQVPPTLPPMVLHHQPFGSNPGDGFSDPRSWHRNPKFGNGYGTDNGFAGTDEVDRSYKRPRVGEFGPPQSSARVSSEDERRLKLIRDHGGASPGGFTSETKKYMQNIALPMPSTNSELCSLGESFNRNDFHSDVKNFEQSSHALNQHSSYPQQDGYQGAVGYQNFPQYGAPRPTGNNIVQPPLPASPPPLPLEPSGHPSSDFKTGSSRAKVSISLFPVSSSALGHPVTEAHSYTQSYNLSKLLTHSSSGFVAEESLTINWTPSVQYVGEGHSFPLKQSSDKPKVIDASQLFKLPYRVARPDHIVIILRGLPGSGKSYLAKLLRDLEVENGGDAPRIHAMDDYFMTEVEKVDDTDVSKSSSSVRSKKPTMKKVMEYCYEPEMEEVYRESMLKAFKRTLEDGIFNFVIVDDRNLRVADFAQFWAIGKRSGYEVYILEATYKDPAGCAARNVHNFTLDDIEEMAGRWEEAPSLYLQLDIKSLFCGDDLKESGIQEVDMDMGDGDLYEDSSGHQESKPGNMKVQSIGGDAPEDSSVYTKKCDTEGDHPAAVKELSRSKWSNDIDEDDNEGSESVKGNLNALSGLIQAYSKEGKSVHWGDQVHDTGFSIGAAKLAKVSSLVIGPGSGYNLNSNPLPKEIPSSNNFVHSKKQTVFQERLRAERESFKAVFDRRKQRIGIDPDED